MRTSSEKLELPRAPRGSVNTKAWLRRRAATGSVRLLVFLSLLALSHRASAQSELEAALPGQPASSLPLVYEQIAIEVREQTVTYVLEQHFRNHLGQPVEGRYLLRTEEGAHVSGFSYWNGEQEIVGEVFERDAARQLYEDVSGQGRDPGLFEQLAEGTFSFRIFPIAPGETKRVRIRYSNWLPLHGDRALVRIPIGRADTRVRASIYDSRGVIEVSSPTHVLTELERSRDQRVLTAQAVSGDATHLELGYRIAARPLTLHTAVHRDEGHDGYLRLSLATPAEAAGEVAPRDVTLVIDRSGSMSGEPLEGARAAALRVVEGLTERDRINVITFDDRAEALFREPAPLDAATRDKVRRHLRALEARDGTDIAQALTRALAAQTKNERPHQILLMTDGQSDPRAAERAARTGDPDARLFTVGLGSGVDKAVLTLLAEQRRGRFVFIPDPGAIEREVAQLLAHIARPVLTDLALELEGATLTEVYPRKLRDLFVADELLVHARIAAHVNAGKPVKAQLRGKLHGAPFVASAAIDARVQAQPAVGAGWARARVDELLTLQAGDDASPAQLDELVELALAYDFVTPFTSFLAIPAHELDAQRADNLRALREQKRQVKALHADAIALSRSALPPGDPLLSVRAARDAQRVTARFPFGLSLDLHWDEASERWLTRFLVPNDVADGPYRVEIEVAYPDGQLELGQIEYVIDSRLSLDLDARAVAGGLVLHASSDEPLKEVRVLVRAADGNERIVELQRASDSCFDAFVPLAPGAYTLRALASDRARNEQIVELATSVPTTSQTWSSPETRACR